jgi:hypothetical protein
MQPIVINRLVSDCTPHILAISVPRIRVHVAAPSY